MTKVFIPFLVACCLYVFLLGCAGYSAETIRIANAQTAAADVALATLEKHYDNALGACPDDECKRGVKTAHDKAFEAHRALVSALSAVEAAVKTVEAAESMGLDPDPMPLVEAVRESAKALADFEAAVEALK